MPPVLSAVTQFALGKNGSTDLAPAITCQGRESQDL